MAQCTGTTQTGERCRRGAARDSEEGRCVNHADDTSYRCRAHNRNSGGKRCGNTPVPGTEVCRLHGGANPTVVAQGQRNILRQQAAKALARAGEDVEAIRDPTTALAQLAGRLRAIELVLWSFLYGDAGTTDDGKPNPQLIRTHGEAAEREARILSDMKRLGLEEDVIYVEQVKAASLAAAMQLILRDLDLTPEQRAVAPGLIRKHLLSIPDSPVSPN